MFSQTSEYALRAIVWLAEHQDSGRYGHVQIAQGTKVPQSYMPKILHELVKTGIINSKRGVGGGFILARPPAEISLYDVINSVDPVQRIRTCPLHLSAHKNQLCPVHSKVDGMLEYTEETLKNCTIQEVLYKANFPIPLTEG